MNKISFTGINLDCFLQQATAINNQECHQGVMSQDNNGQIRFEEKAGCLRTWERNPHIFEGQYINMARRKNGSLKFNFKNVNASAPDFNANDFAFGVYCEIALALNNIK